MAAIRHEFYETDEFLTLSIFDRGADPTQVDVQFANRKISYTHGDKALVLEPLKGQINPAASTFTVGKVKVEVRLAKAIPGRWGGLLGDSPDPLANSAAPSSSDVPTRRVQSKKNWEGITTEILSSEKEKSTEEDPNVGGDSTLNGFFQKIFKDADDDTKRAMMKSYSESGGTTLSTNWDEVKKAPVEVKPPQGSEWKNSIARDVDNDVQTWMLRLTIIVAATKTNGIGQNAGLPWRLPREMKYFAQVTTATPEGTTNAVLMGRNTWESIPEKYRPLSRRVNLVTSRNVDHELESSPDAPSHLHNNLVSALEQLNSLQQLHRAFVIGGASMYSESLALTPGSSAVVDRILLTRILTDFDDCDVFMADFLKEGIDADLPWTQSSHSELEGWVGFKVPEGEQEERGVKYEFQMWTRAI
ncbi:hypothetical protein H0H87_000139 [Tephrocybe sp. NHM501043]|nr:hypothetical protein H0H87_000139 [Tephrocybe sp. NHM501043]